MSGFYSLFSTHQLNINGQGCRLSDKPNTKVCLLLGQGLEGLNHMFSVFLLTGGLYYKCFTIIIYYCNDSGQYYKTTITIVIYDPNQF